MKKNLVLTGMMGVGKSTIGKSLARKLSYNFVDIDRLIEIKEGKNINLIFQSKVKVTLENLKIVSVLKI